MIFSTPMNRKSRAASRGITFAVNRNRVLMSSGLRNIAVIKRKSVLRTTPIWLAILLFVACLGVLGFLVTMTLGVLGIE